MSHKLIIKTKSLKDLLALFSGSEQLDNLELGDTWHPSSGYVDEGILNSKHLISDIRDFNYDFEGLIQFSCNIRTMSIKLVNRKQSSDEDEYEVLGLEKDLRLLQDKVIELNAYCQNYNLKLETIYD